MTTTIIATPALAGVTGAVRTALRSRPDWAAAAELVADALRGRLPGPEVLTPEQRLGDPDGPVGHLLHAEPDGSFSVTAVIWRPGQTTRIHDHVTWCVVGVLQGVEHEERFDADLRPIGAGDNRVGEVTGFAPPGDIHLIRNTGAETAISLHVYGTDLSRVGSSARRYYESADAEGRR
ncbi:cysteine dioxygenase family protein [Glycomyces endophyticus]|uniref:Cysteine dioxygenase family protein n=1 Tax=Glycomyces endophyticus TaxID=480996 RepID=A0ABP4TX93_9ACTN